MVAASSSAAMRLMDRVPQSIHWWMSMSSPPDSCRYLFLSILRVSPIGFICPLHADRRSPAAYRSRWQDHKQYGQWLRLLTPERKCALDTSTWQCPHLKSPKVEALCLIAPPASACSFDNGTG